MIDLPFAAALKVTACNQAAEKNAGSGQEVANKLENAAEQSGPAAKQVLDKVVNHARRQPSMAPVNEPSSFAQETMTKAGNAEASQAAAGQSQV